jgi:hypothetical protein
MDKLNEELIEKHGCRLNTSVRCRYLKESVSKDINNKKLVTCYCECEDATYGGCIPSYEYKPDE